jgi:hypothetical protein
VLVHVEELEHGLGEDNLAGAGVKRLSVRQFCKGEWRRKIS